MQTKYERMVREFCNQLDEIFSELSGYKDKVCEWEYVG